jgi:predicted dehydrogenase
MPACVGPLGVGRAIVSLTTGDDLVGGGARAGWGIVGTGKIARIFARDLAEARLGRLAAVGSRDPARGAAFVAELGPARVHTDPADLMSDPEVGFVYVATPHPTHERLAMAAAEAGKHVLCEKPLAVNAAGARRMVAAAAEAGTFLMEAFAFRCHPQSLRLAELVTSGAIGEVRAFVGAFGYDAGPAPGNYLHRPDLAGGSILDVGCYTVALARQVAGLARGLPFADPVRVAGAGMLHPTHGVDLDAGGIAWFEDGFTAHLSCSIRTALDSLVTITGTRGTIRIPAPWLPGKYGGTPRLIVHERAHEAEEVLAEADLPLYALEADTVVARAREGRLQADEMSWADSVGNMEALDRWRAGVGVRYAEDADQESLVDSVS